MSFSSIYGNRQLIVVRRVRVWVRSPLTSKRGTLKYELLALNEIPPLRLFRRCLGIHLSRGSVGRGPCNLPSHVTSMTCRLVTTVTYSTSPPLIPIGYYARACRLDCVYKHYCKFTQTGRVHLIRPGAFLLLSIYSASRFSAVHLVSKPGFTFARVSF